MVAHALSRRRPKGKASPIDSARATTTRHPATRSSPPSSTPTSTTTRFDASPSNSITPATSHCRPALRRTSRAESRCRRESRRRHRAPSSCISCRRTPTTNGGAAVRTSCSFKSPRKWSPRSGEHIAIANRRGVPCTRIGAANEPWCVHAALLWLVCTGLVRTRRRLSAGYPGVQAGQYGEARDRFTRAYDAGGARTDAALQPGRRATKLGDYPAASTSFEQVANDPIWGPLRNTISASSTTSSATRRRPNNTTESRTTAQSEKPAAGGTRIVQPSATRSDADNAWFGTCLQAAVTTITSYAERPPLVGVNESDYSPGVRERAASYRHGERAGVRTSSATTAAIAT